jgi:ubiquinone/menaquinone biosynthesis C-methylase UbiE
MVAEVKAAQERPQQDPVDRDLKMRHAKMWALGDYARVADDIVSPLGEVVVAACDVRDGQRVLDVAAGSGNAAIPAASRGANVVASDLTPELLEVGANRAESFGLDIDWHVADAEALPYDDGSFDTVVSCLGAMFAPHHQASADELVRVTSPGGTIGLVSWTPEGFIGQMFATMKPYAPPPPAGAQPPPLWGNPRHVESLLGDRVTDVLARRSTLKVDYFATGEEFRDYFKQCYGPTILAYRNIESDKEKVESLDRELAELGNRNLAGNGGSMQWEYLLFTCRTTG